MSKKTSRKATKPVHRASPTTALAPEQAASLSKQIADTVRSDMQVAEIGLFHSLRVGVGLLRIKDMALNGEWENRMLELFPDKTARTLQTYMKVATNFLVPRGLEPRDVWDKMVGIRTDRLLAAPADAAPEKGKNKTDPIETEVGEFVREFGSIRKAAKGESEEDPKDGRPLTKAERIEGARAIWNKIAGMAQEELNRDSAALLNNDDLDGLASVLRTISDALRKQLARRS